MAINNVSIDGVPSLSTDTSDEQYFYSLINVPAPLVAPTVTKTFSKQETIPGLNNAPPTTNTKTCTHSISLQLEKTTVTTPGWPVNSHVYTVCQTDDKIAFYYVTDPWTSYKLVKQGDVVNGCTIGKIANYYGEDGTMLCVAEVGGSTNFIADTTYSVNNDPTLQITVKAGRGIMMRAAILGVFATDYKRIRYTTNFNRPDVQAEAKQNTANRAPFGVVSRFSADYTVTDQKVETDLFSFTPFEGTDTVAEIEKYNTNIFDFSRTPDELSQSLYASRTNVNQSWFDDFNASVIGGYRSAKQSVESNENFTLDKQTPTVDGSDVENKKTISTWREYPQNCGPVTYPLFAFNTKNNDTTYALDSDESRPVIFSLFYKPVAPLNPLFPPIPGAPTSFVTSNCTSTPTSGGGGATPALPPPAQITYYPDGTINSVYVDGDPLFTTDDYVYSLTKKATWRIKSSTDLLPTVNETFSNPFITSLEFTFLTADVSSTDTTIPVINTVGFTNCGYIAIPSYELTVENIGNYDAVNEKRTYKFNGIEYIYYTGKTATSFTGCTRGVFGSTPRNFNKLNSRVLDYQRNPVNQYLPFKIGPVD